MRAKPRGIVLATALLATVCLLAAPAAARPSARPVVITDKDVDELIQELVDYLLGTQSDKWVVQPLVKKRSARGRMIKVPDKIIEGELLGVRKGYVEIQYKTSSGRRRKLKIPREFIVRFSKKGSSCNVTFRTRKQRRNEPLAKVPTKTHTGAKLLKDVSRAWIFKTADGRKMTIPPASVFGPHGPGHFSSKGTLGSGAGVSALVTLALLKAGVPPANPKMKMALEYLRGHEQLAGADLRWRGRNTYGQSLRANVWEHVMEMGGDSGNRSGYRRLLVEDAAFLEEGMSADGWYAYNHRKGVKHAGRGDHSNTQFGVLGMWAAASARLEVSKDYWKTVTKHWLKYQSATGGWGYGATGGRFTMTTAGLNCLYLVLDFYHSRKMGAYQRFKGIRYNAKVAKEIARVFKAIDKGLDWMRNPKDRSGSRTSAYGQYGLERLGVASGLKRIGGKDWYRRGVNRVWRHRGKVSKLSVVNASFWLMFLAYGRAPVIFNKLRLADDIDWNYYFRDLHYMCRFLTKNFERIHKWQVVSLDEHAGEDLADAPILFISGTKPLKLTDVQLARLKRFLEGGGAVLLHATRRSTAFANSARKTLTELFADRGYEFKKLPDDHPLYTVHYGRGRALKGMDFEGMSDGARTFAFLSTNDIAGAWQQNLEQSQRDLFEVMTNLRIYAAPGYFELPSRMRTRKTVATSATPKNTLRIARVKHVAHWNANPTLWDEFNPTLTFRTGVTAKLAAKPVELKNAEELAGVDLLQLVGHGKFALTAEQLAVLAGWLKSGGMLLMDCSGGKARFAKSAEQLFLDLMRATGGQTNMIAGDHKIITGEFPGGRPAGNTVYNRWGIAGAGGGAVNLKTIRLADRDVVLYSPIDLSATLNGHFIYRMPAYNRKFAEKLVANIIALRHHHLNPAAAVNAATP